MKKLLLVMLSSVIIGQAVHAGDSPFDHLETHAGKTGRDIAATVNHCGYKLLKGIQNRFSRSSRLLIFGTGIVIGKTQLPQSVTNQTIELSKAVTQTISSHPIATAVGVVFAATQSGRALTGHHYSSSRDCNSILKDSGHSDEHNKYATTATFTAGSVGASIALSHALKPAARLLLNNPVNTFLLQTYRFLLKNPEKSLGGALAGGVCGFAVMRAYQDRVFTQNAINHDNYEGAADAAGLERFVFPVGGALVGAMVAAKI